MNVYRYFRDPHAYSYWSEEPGVCDICGVVGPGYGGGFYGETETELVCEPCLATGRLTEIGSSSNDGDIQALTGQLRERGLEEREVASLVEQLTDELEHRTPQISRWQDWFWPAHCGDYCEYVKIAGHPDIVQMAGQIDPAEWLLAHIYADDLETTDIESLWENIRDDSPTNAEISYSLEVYMFRCLGCGEAIFRWDCD